MNSPEDHIEQEVIETQFLEREVNGEVRSMEVVRVTSFKNKNANGNASTSRLIIHSPHSAGLEIGQNPEDFSLESQPFLQVFPEILGQHNLDDVTPEKRELILKTLRELVLLERDNLILELAYSVASKVAAAIQDVEVLVIESKSMLRLYVDLNRRFRDRFKDPRNALRSIIDFEKNPQLIEPLNKAYDIYMQILEKYLENLKGIWFDFHSMNVRSSKDPVDLGSDLDSMLDYIDSYTNPSRLAEKNRTSDFQTKAASHDFASGIKEGQVITDEKLVDQIIFQLSKHNIQLTKDQVYSIPNFVTIFQVFIKILSNPDASSVSLDMAIHDLAQTKDLNTIPSTELHQKIRELCITPKADSRKIEEASTDISNAIAAQLARESSYSGPDPRPSTFVSKHAINARNAEQREEDTNSKNQDRGIVNS